MCENSIKLIFITTVKNSLLYKKCVHFSVTQKQWARATSRVLAHLVLSAESLRRAARLTTLAQTFMYQESPHKTQTFDRFKTDIRLNQEGPERLCLRSAAKFQNYIQGIYKRMVRF